MKVSLNWIRDYVDLPQDLSAEQLAYDLTMRTVEVEGWEEPAKSLENILVGEILSVEAHPQADRLRVCQVAAGRPEPYQIVCGGSNLYAGEKIALAIPGAKVVWHGEGEPVVIKAGKLRGVASEGMICGANEIGLDALFPPADDHEIVDLTAVEGAEAGRPVADLLGLDDCILEIDNKSMTNRPDLWGHYGLARELAAIYKLPLKPLPAFDPSVATAPEKALPVEIQGEDCAAYTAVLFDGLKNDTAPWFIRKRLALLGHKPKGVLIDLTNYVMLATGQPCHGFDRNCVTGGIVVRPAKEGERLVLLDESEVELLPTDCLIADHEKAIALAGIMGGKDDSLHPETEQMVLEVANFRARTIRRTAARLGQRSDAEMRFEKGLDTQRMSQTLGLFQKLLAEIQPAAKLLAVTEVLKQATPPVAIELKLDYLATRLGRRLAPAEIAETLAALGFAVEGVEAAAAAEAKGEKAALTVHVPSWRATGDVSMQADLVEEVARMIGYENFKFEAPAIQLEAAVKAPVFDLERRIKTYLAERAGLQEVFTYPWIETELAEIAGMDLNKALQLANPPSPEQRYLRSSIIPGLLATLQLNRKHSDQFAVFELTQVFEQGETHPSTPDETLPYCHKSLGLAILGLDAMTVFRRAKGYLEVLPEATQCEPWTARVLAAEERLVWADRDLQVGFVDQNGKLLAKLGMLSRRVLDELGLKHCYAAVAEVDVEGLTQLPSRDNRYKALPLYPVVEQDLSILVPDELTWNEVREVVEPQVAGLAFLYEYRGAQIPEGKKSLSFRLTFEKADGTFTSEEIEERMRGLVKRLSKKLGAELRV